MIENSDKNKDILRLRALILRAVRSFFDSRGFLEVETPLRIPANAPEEYIEPCRTGDWYLHTSPEICMKRLLCRGHSKIYQICRCWRDTERGNNHLPEFTMLEWYRTDSDYTDLMRDCEELLQFVSDSLMSYKSDNCVKLPNVIDDVIACVSAGEAFRQWGGIAMEDAIRDGSFDEVMALLIEPALAHEGPLFLIDYPIEKAALARPKPGDDALAERFELYVGGLELANGFSELNDPQEQRKRFDEANRRRTALGMHPLPLPNPFLEELSAMPPSAGIALGIDRLVMLFSGATRIDDVVAFTPEVL